jgi:hypothetical protein
MAVAPRGPGTAQRPGTARPGLRDACVPDEAVPKRTVPPRKAHEIVRGGSGDKQAKAKLGSVESDEVTVVFSPPPRDKVLTEIAYRPLLGLRPDSGPHRYSATYPVVEICLRPTPVRLEEAVSTVPRNQYWLRAGSDRIGPLGERRPPDEKVSDLGR